jgi:hypothetical protein
MTRRKLPDLQEIKCLNKKSFRSERIARQRADVRQAEIGQPLYTYRCPHCKDYHLTRAWQPGQ